jgi:hypothetical protein
MLGDSLTPVVGQKGPNLGEVQELSLGKALKIRLKGLRLTLNFLPHAVAVCLDSQSNDL